jgi:glycerol-3-phosphate dehydrogenase (NAD(P)+)
MKIAVLGGGAWGTAMAVHVAGTEGLEAALWLRDAAQAAALAASRHNDRYLPGLALPPALRISADRAQVLAGAGLALIATPMAALRATLAAWPAGLPVLWLCKGFEAGTARLGHEIAAGLGLQSALGALSGPSFAAEVARGQPTALVAASAEEGLRRLAQQVLHGGALRVYTSADLIGVEVGGAVKNVIAIATGMLDGLAAAAAPGAGSPALNARAALITRALAEITRLGLALGARAETFMGLSGLGDLVLTSTGALSRNRALGARLAQGEPLAAALAALGHVAEGVPSAAMVLQRAAGHGVEMPICAAVLEVIEGRLTPRQALAGLMEREARTES